MGRSAYFSPSSLYISLTFSMNFRISVIAASGERIFAARPKVATHAQNGGDNSTGSIATKWPSSTGINTVSLPNWSMTASANRLIKRIFTFTFSP